MGGRRRGAIAKALQGDALAIRLIQDRIAPARKERSVTSPHSSRTAACGMIRARTLLNRSEKLEIPPPPGKAPFVFELSRFTRDERDELKAVLIAIRDGYATKEDHKNVIRFMAMSRGTYASG